MISGMFRHTSTVPFNAYMQEDKYYLRDMVSGNEPVITATNVQNGWIGDGEKEEERNEYM